MTEGCAYDVVDYPPLIHAAMHPAKLAAIARLHGIPAASPASCTLLEVGCGDALQLVTLAQAYPKARFIGVDLSPRAIARGEAMRQSLGLHNLDLIAADLMDWEPGDITFDYVLAHGFYSWVPEIVRERLLAVCSRWLAPSGVAYISYNALPGCHLRRMLWEMLRFHVRDVTEPGERLQQAREFLAWLGGDVMERGAYGPAVRTEAERLLNETHPAVLFHDDLAELNTPFTLTGFVEQASRHGLAFLGEADYHEMNPALLGAEALARFRAICGKGRIEDDQYLDFLKGRRFRQSLVCHASQPVSAKPEQNEALSMAVVAHMRSEPVVLEPGDTREVVRFASAEGAAFSTDHVVAKAALQLVSNAFPLPVDVGSLLARAREGTGSTATIDEDAKTLGLILVKGFELGLLSLQLDPPRFATEAGEYPIASALAMLQVEQGHDLIANLRPSLVRLDSRPAMELLRLLDGTRNRDAILRDLANRMADVGVPGDNEGELVRHDAAWWEQQLGPTLEDALALCVRMALLVED